MLKCTQCGAEFAEFVGTFCPCCGGKGVPVTTKPKKKIYKKAWFWVVAAFVLFSVIIGASNSGSGGDVERNDVQVFCDITKYANISSEELVALMGQPDSTTDGTINSDFAGVPCTYYDYNAAEALGEVSFVLVRDRVVKFVAYNNFPLYKKNDLPKSLNVTLSDKCVMAVDSETALRYRCVSEGIDDVWVTNIDGNTYGFLSVTYDMAYYEEWYLPLSSNEEVNLMTDVQQRMKNVLTSPKSAKFPWGGWDFAKNAFYIAVSSYVDSQNAFGTEVRTTFTFIYSRITNEPIYVIINGEVVVDNGYVPTAELVKQLVK